MRVIRVTAKAAPGGCFHLKIPLDAADELDAEHYVRALRAFRRRHRGSTARF